jgi:ABC-type nitrate/sulfonate/bicarbonate transport system ATPase subunit
MVVSEESKTQNESSLAQDFALEVRDLSVQLAGRAVLTNLNLKVRRGEFVALLGRSGCGKSTLLKVAAGEQRPTSGQLLTPKRVGYAQQSSPLFPWMSVLRNVALAGAAETNRDQREAAALQMLEAVGLQDHARKRPHSISGGMRTRATLVRAFMPPAELVLLDEPFAALDPVTASNLYEVTLQLWRVRGTAVVLVTHNFDEAMRLADRILVMKPDGSGWALDQRLPQRSEVQFDLRRARSSAEDLLWNKLWIAVEGERQDG